MADCLAVQRPTLSHSLIFVLSGGEGSGRRKKMYSASSTNFSFPVGWMDGSLDGGQTKLSTDVSGLLERERRRLLSVAMMLWLDVSYD